VVSQTLNRRVAVAISSGWSSSASSNARRDSNRCAGGYGHGAREQYSRNLLWGTHLAGAPRREQGPAFSGLSTTEAHEDRDCRDDGDYHADPDPLPQ